MKKYNPGDSLSTEITKEKLIELIPASPDGYAGTSRAKLVEMIRKAVKAEGGRVALKGFLAGHSLVKRDVFKHFAKWSEALRAAGCDAVSHNTRVESTALLEDWGNVAGKVRGIPTVKEYVLHGRHEAGTVSRRFGSWLNLPEAFRRYAGRKPEWAGVMGHLGRSTRRRERLRARLSAEKRVRQMTRRAKSPKRMKHRPACGVPIGDGPLRNAPTNELGVVFLFGTMAERLGFHVEGLQAAFPDCHALRRIAPDLWQPVTIEFEYESRNFLIHGHDAKGCDVIVCWVDNWRECPKSLEVIALRDFLRG